MKNLKWIIMILVGLLFLVTVGIVYVPLALEKGMYEFELTFLSNTIVGILFVSGGCYGLIKKKNWPQPIFLHSVILLQMVFLICMAFISEFNFAGGLVFLHIINPILATAVFFFCTTCREMPKIKVLLSAIAFPLVYLIYVIVYGYASGVWLYGILNIPDRGIGFVSLLVLIVALGTLLFEWVQYKISYGFYRRQHVGKGLDERYEFREILQNEAEQAVEIEQICFPPNEACSEKMMKERILAVPELFFVACDRSTGELAGFVNGLATDEDTFRDEFFTDASLNNTKGKNVMVLGLDVLPQHRNQGLAREIISRYVKREQGRKRANIILTCLDSKVAMYEKMGFRNCGIANSTWGAEQWYEMSYDLNK